MKEYEKLLCAALEDLHRAAQELERETAPHTPEPRPKFMHFSEATSWPRLYEDSIYWGRVRGVGFTWSLSYLTDREGICNQIPSDCQYQPRLILRSLRRIQSATAWCYARAEGRKRQAEEILRQQQAAVEALEAEAALQSLKK